MDLGISGRNALITGGSKGIGRACAEALAIEGVNIAIVSRDPKSLESAAAELSSNFKGYIVPITGDLTKGAEIERVVAEAEELWGKLTY